MTRISISRVLMVALSSYGASAKSFGSPRDLHVHPAKPLHKFEVHNISFGIEQINDSTGGGSIKGKRR